MHSQYGEHYQDTQSSQGNTHTHTQPNAAISPMSLFDQTSDSYQFVFQQSSSQLEPVGWHAEQ